MWRFDVLLYSSKNFCHGEVSDIFTWCCLFTLCTRNRHWHSQNASSVKVNEFGPIFLFWLNIFCCQNVGASFANIIPLTSIEGGVRFISVVRNIIETDEVGLFIWSRKLLSSNLYHLSTLATTRRCPCIIAVSLALTFFLSIKMSLFIVICHLSHLWHPKSFVVHLSVWVWESVRDAELLAATRQS